MIHVSVCNSGKGRNGLGGAPRFLGVVGGVREENEERGEGQTYTGQKIGG